MDIDMECRTCGRPLMPGDDGPYCWEHKAPPQTDLFSERRVIVPGNPTLEQSANLILRLTTDRPELLDGDTVGTVDRAIYAEVLIDSGLRSVLAASKDQELLFRQLVVGTAGPRDSDVLRRARRWLQEHDEIRLSAAAVRDAEQHRARVGHSLGATGGE
jgi:hypothetical protein